MIIAIQPLKQAATSFSPPHLHQLPAAQQLKVSMQKKSPFLLPLLAKTTKMTSNKDGSNTYPSIDGSDVLRSPGFWTLPTLVSSPAWSCQSMVTNLSSQPDKMSYGILFDYPTQASRGYRILEDLTEWFDEASNFRAFAQHHHHHPSRLRFDIFQLLTHTTLNDRRSTSSCLLLRMSGARWRK